MFHTVAFSCDKSSTAAKIQINNRKKTEFVYYLPFMTKAAYLEVIIFDNENKINEKNQCTSYWAFPNDKFSTAANKLISVKTNIREL